MNKTKPKLLVLSHISELAGGAEMSMLEVMDIWARDHGVQPEFIIRKPVGSLGPALEKRGWRYHALPYTFWSEGTPPQAAEQKHKAASQNTQAVLEIEKIIQAAKPDVVLTNSVVCPWAALAAYYQRVPHVWFIREYGDLDHGRVFELGREQTFQDVDLLSQLVITNSETLATHVSQYVPADKVTTLYHPFDTDAMQAAAAQSVPTPFKSKDSLKLVIIGGIAESKGHQEVIQAVGELNQKGYDTEFCVIGRGDPAFINTLHELMKKYKIADKVHFAGFQKNPLALAAHADVGIMSSRMEAFGRVTFEYMVLGKPVVGVGAGGTPEMVKDGSNGYLYKYRDTASLVAALMHYAKDRSLVAKHGQNSITHAKSMMNGKHTVASLYKKVEKVMGMNRNELPRPFHFSHAWLSYPQVADEYIKNLGAVSAKKLLARQAKARVRHVGSNLKAKYRRMKG
ncbi:MAG TPA: glycosyltransferase [Candidatus Limnocylindria bacterium]|nr:glycosyltransferase [Candidatus Limnocylindria bacterium]